MRPIDADKLKKELVDTPFYFRCETTPDMLTSVQDRLNECLEAIDSMPTLDSVPEWHDLTKNPDDLPQYYERVLCYISYKPYNSFGWSKDYAIGCVVPIMDDENIVKQWSGDATRGKYARVLRWQRIIDPLKEETKCE